MKFHFGSKLILGILALGADLSSSFALAGSPFTFSSIENLLKQPEVTTVEDFIRVLPSEYRRRYLLVHTSRSLQPASPERPRVISYGRGDYRNIVMAFNGDPSFPGFDAVEVMEINHTNHKLELHEITFSGPGTRPHVSAVNPSKCTACHGDNPRPNWDTYFLWPGVFGAESNGIVYPESKNKYPLEHALYSKYLAVRDQHPRYSQLVPLDIPDTYEDFRQSAPRPSEFNILIGEYNEEVFLGEILSSQYLKPFRFAVQGAIRCVSRPVTDFLPKELVANAVLSPDAAKDRVLAEIGEGMRSRVARHLNILGLSSLKELESSKVLSRAYEEYGASDMDHPWVATGHHYGRASSRLEYLLVNLGDTLRAHATTFGRTYFDTLNAIQDPFGFYALRRFLSLSFVAEGEPSFGRTAFEWSDGGIPNGPQGTEKEKEGRCDELVTRSLKELNGKVVWR